MAFSLLDLKDRLGQLFNNVNPRQLAPKVQNIANTYNSIARYTPFTPTIPTPQNTARFNTYVTQPFVSAAKQGVKSFGNLALQNSNYAQAFRPQAIPQTTPQQKLREFGNIAGAYGALTQPINSIIGGGINVGLNKLTKGKQTNPQAYRQGFDMASKLSPIGQVADMIPGFNQAGTKIAKIVPKYGNTVGGVAANVAKEFTKGAAYGAIEGQNPITTGAQFAPFGVLGAGKSADEIRKGLDKGALYENPIARRIGELAMKQDKARLSVDEHGEVYDLAKEYLNIPSKELYRMKPEKVLSELQSMFTKNQDFAYRQLPGMGFVAKPGSKQLPPLKAVLESDAMAKQSLQPNYTPITVENGKVGKLQPQQNLKQLLAPGVNPQESVAQTRGRIINSQTETDPFLRGLQKDKAIFEKTGKFGSVTNTIASPQGQPITTADAEQLAGKAQITALENKKGFQDIFAKWIGKRDSSKTMGIQSGAKFADIPKELGPKIINYIESPNKKAPPEVKQYASQISQEFDKLYKEATDAGIEMGYIKNYVTHIWNKPQEEVQAMYRAAKQRGFFQNERSIPTYEEGIKMGLTPKYTTPQQILAEYSRKLNELKANVDLFKNLKSQNLIVDSYVGATRPGFEPLTAPGFPRSSSMGGNNKVYQGFYYAPKEIAQKLNQVFNTTNDGLLGKGAAAGKKISGTIQDVTLSGGLPFTPLNAFTFAQMTKEGVSGRIKSPVTSLIRSISDKHSFKFFQENAGQLQKMQERNIPISSNFDVENLVKNATVSRSLGEKIGNMWSKAVNDPTFKRFMPMLQVNFFNDVEKQALKSGVSPQQAADIAAQATKNFYGITGSNITAQRNKLGQDVLGTVFFAPKFRESMISFWGNNIKALSPVHAEFNGSGISKVVPTGFHLNNPLSIENRSNTKFLVGATLVYAGMDQANRAFNNGRPMSENPPGTEDKLLIPVGNGRTIAIPFLSSIATIPRGIYRQGKMLAQGDVPGAFKDAGQTYLSSGLKPLADIAANSDYFGKSITTDDMTSSQKFGAMAKYIGTQLLAHPYIKEIFDPRNQEDPAYERLSRAMELPFKFYEDKNLKAKYYYGARDNALKGLKEVEQQAFNSIPKFDKEDPNDPNSRILKYQIYLTYPKVFDAKQQIEIDTAKQTGKAIDPLYLVNYDTAKRYMRYETLPEGSQDRKDLIKAYPELGALFDVRSKYFAENPIEGAPTSKRPLPSSYVQQQMDLKNWKDPEVRAYLDANTAWNNSQRDKLGLPPLAGFKPYVKKPKKINIAKISVPKVSSRKFKLSTPKISAPPKIKIAKMSKIKPIKIKAQRKITLKKS